MECTIDIQIVIASFKIYEKVIKSWLVCKRKEAFESVEVKLLFEQCVQHGRICQEAVVEW